MSNTKHTPGPWRTLNLVSATAIHAASGSRVCHLSYYVEFNGSPCGSIESQDKTQEEIDANARLISAAPELLEALEMVVGEASPVGDKEMATISFNQLTEVRAAIAKAKGDDE